MSDSENDDAPLINLTKKKKNVITDEGEDNSPKKFEAKKIQSSEESQPPPLIDLTPKPKSNTERSSKSTINNEESSDKHEKTKNKNAKSSEKSSKSNDETTKSNNKSKESDDKQIKTIENEPSKQDTVKKPVNKNTPAKSSAKTKNDKENGSNSTSKVTPSSKRKRDSDDGETKAPKKNKPIEKKKTQESSEEEEEDSSELSSSESEESSSESEESSSSSESSSESSDDDVPLSSLKKSPKNNKDKKKKTLIKQKKVTPKKKVKGESEKETKKKPKKEKEEEEVYKWWLDDPLPKGKKWKTLVHNGVLFPPPYVPHGVSLIYDGKEVALTPEQEELATYYANYLETDHVKKPQFNKNFFEEFLKVLNPKVKKGTPKTKHIITDFNKCDFSLIHRHLENQKELRKNRTKEEKQKEKEEKEELQKKYGYAIVDGHKQKIANFRIEPPGLFLGRGNHPKAGMLKKRITPADVTLNLSKGAKIPECPIPGESWKAIENNDEVSWLAFWKDNITDSIKYVWLAPSSRVKGEADMKKFETARKLKKYIKRIREKYMQDLSSKTPVIKQRATALYLIDHLALRVGNEKDEDEADTVGCCSLRVEHITLKEPDIVEFDFLGKDSMRYQNSVSVHKQVFKNLKEFTLKSDPKDELFHELTPAALNSHLKQEMEGLTAKVFRTYNASITLEKELLKMNKDEYTLVEEKMLFYNRANREVAILCNHQRTVSKNFGEQVGKIDEKIDEIKKEIQELKQHLKEVKSGSTPKRKREEEEGDDDEEKKKKEKTK